MQLYALLAGVPDSAILSVVAQPDETIATGLDRIVEKFQATDLPHEFTAYAAKHNGLWPLSEDAPDRIALRKGDATAMACYLTPTAQLDPTMTVLDHIGDWEQFPADRIAIVLHWTLASWDQYAVRTQLSKVETAATLAQHHEREDHNWLQARRFRPCAQALASGPATSSAVRLDVLVVGVRDLVVSVMAQPSDTIETVRNVTITKAYALLCQRLYGLEGVFKFTLYSAQQNGAWPLCPGTADRLALEKNDSIVMLRYLTASARLDRKKTVADYFADGVPSDAVAMVLWWAPASLEKYRAVREQLEKLEKAERTERCIKQRKVARTPPTPTAAQTTKVVEPREHHGSDGCADRTGTGSAAVVSAFQWLSDMLSGARPSAPPFIGISDKKGN